jgi:hypothetical protein
MHAVERGSKPSNQSNLQHEGGLHNRVDAFSKDFVFVLAFWPRFELLLQA